MTSETLNFETLVSVIDQTHLHFQQQAAKAVNVSLTVRNYLIGFYITEFELKGEDRAKYGIKLFDALAARFKHIKGIDRRSLYRFKDFYQYYPQLQSEIVQETLLLNETLAHKIVGLPTPQSESKEIVPAKKI